MDSGFKSVDCKIHPDEQVLGVCLVDKCEFATRLVCFTCSTEDHSEHAKFIVKLADLETKTTLQHRNWPQVDLAQDVKKYLDQVSFLMEGGDAAIDKLFEEITSQVLTELEKAKKTVKKEMEKYLSTNSSNDPEDLTSRLRDQITEIFDITKLGNLFNSLRNSEITENEFNSDVADFTKTVNSEELLNPIQKLIDEEQKNIKKILDTDIVKDKIQDVVSLIRMIPEEIVTDSVIGCPLKWVAEEKNQGSIIIGQNGRYAKMPSSYQGIYSSIAFERGRWEFEFETISNMSSNCVLFGLIPESTKDNSQGTYSSHIYHCFGNSCSGMCTAVGTPIQTDYKQGNIMRIFIDMENNQYEFGWKGKTGQHINSGYVLKGQKLRFFINSYGMGNLEFQIVQARRSCASELGKDTTSSKQEETTTPVSNLEGSLDEGAGGLFD